MPTPLEQVLAAVQPLGGSAWIDEILIRGQPGGGIRGAHVVIGWEAPGIMGGTERGLSGPWPLSASVDDEEFAALADLLAADMADQLTALQGTLAESVAELTTATNRIAELEAQLERQLSETTKAKDAVIAALTAQLQAAQSVHAPKETP